MHHLKFDINPFLKGEAAIMPLLSEMLGMLDVELLRLRRDKHKADFHHIRSILRRASNLLENLKTLPPPTAEFLVSEFKKLNELTAKANALQEFFANEKRYTSAVPRMLRPGLVKVFNAVNAELTEERLRIAKAVANKRYESLFGGCQTRVLAALASIPKGEDSMADPDNVTCLVKRLVGQTFHEFYNQGGKLRAESSPLELEVFRSTCRKIRYVLELFASLFEEKGLSGIATPLEKLQELLGKIDAHGSAIQTIEGYMSTTNPAMEFKNLSFAAMGALIAILQAKRLKARNALRKHLEEIKQKQFHESLDSLLRR